MIMRALITVTLLLLASCGGGEPVVAPESAAPSLQQIAPDDFALLDCGVKAASGTCVIISAGGKRLLVGAPAGIGAALGPNDLGGLDAVLLPGLAAYDLEGLDEVRNQGWVAGRRSPLPVAGPKGLVEIARALNGAYQTADAIAQVSDDPEGGFGAALIAPDDGGGAPRWTAFNTGDLVVEALSAGPFSQAYLVSYADLTLLIRPCGSTGMENLPASDRTLSCADNVAEETATAITWPLPAPVFFVLEHQGE